MSLILEALRKSEAERRRGAAPDLLTPVVNVPPRATRAWPAWAVPAGVAAALLVVLGGIALWRMRDEPAPLPPAATELSESVRDKVAGAHSPAPPRTPPPATTTTTIAATPAASTAKPAMTQAAPEGYAGQGQAAQEQAVEQREATTPAQAATLPATPALVLPPPIAAPPPAAQTAPPAPASSEFVSPQATIRLADLPAEERSQLPALKVSMHMWAPAPADRFVIIDGARLAEGDRVADATLQAIHADGVTLAWRGRQIRLPIR